MEYYFGLLFSSSTGLGNTFPMLLYLGSAEELFRIVTQSIMWKATGGMPLVPSMDTEVNFIFCFCSAKRNVVFFLRAT